MSSDQQHQGREVEKVTRQELRAEQRDFLQTQEQRRKVFARAIAVGLLAGALAVAFRWALVGGDTVRNGLVAWAHRYPAWGWLLPTLFGAAGAGLAVYLVNSLAPETTGSAIPHLKAVLYRLRSLCWRRILPVEFFGGCARSGVGWHWDGRALACRWAVRLGLPWRNGSR
jgi:chloride channel protein, CIC family